MPPFDKASLRREWQIFLLALGFLSRIPVPRDPDFSPEKLDGAARYFPLVGLLIGGVTAIALLVFFALFNNPLLAVLLSMAVGLLLTGAFHEDGLADSADGFGGGWRRDDVLRIMKDSR
ncbi:adenosylcobinamide-GDP ribazoletransferase, partial [Spongiibacter marinus]|uniref:adenosylcobinamide-GDP ribazoletransferase n=1 Tax=Spongiibacter marinus TaxID=354246 RepID=UPI003C477A65